MDRITEIRNAEKESHNAIYSLYKLYDPGSWLSKPVRTLLELLPLFEEEQTIRALDLGCGVGRNSIPIAQYFSPGTCNVVCVDILELAIEKLLENAREHQVQDNIHGVLSSIDEYKIAPDHYDLILSVSALEHVATPEFLQKNFERF